MIVRQIIFLLKHMREDIKKERERVKNLFKKYMDKIKDQQKEEVDVLEDFIHEVDKG